MCPGGTGKSGRAGRDQLQVEGQGGRARRPARPCPGSGPGGPPARTRTGGGRRRRTASRPGRPGSCGPGPRPGRWPAGGVGVAVDVVGRHHLDPGPVGQADQGVVAGRVERVAVVPDLLERAPGRTPCRPAGRAGRRPPPGLLGKGERHRPPCGTRSTPVPAVQPRGAPGPPGAPPWPRHPLRLRDGPTQPRVPLQAPRASTTRCSPARSKSRSPRPTTSRAPEGVRVSSAPNTVGRESALAASANRTMPYIPSWSVTASASSRSHAASSASSSGCDPHPESSRSNGNATPHTEPPPSPPPPHLGGGPRLGGRSVRLAPGRPGRGVSSVRSGGRLGGGGRPARRRSSSDQGSGGFCHPAPDDRTYVRL